MADRLFEVPGSRMQISRIVFRGKLKSVALHTKHPLDLGDMALLRDAVILEHDRNRIHRFAGILSSKVRHEARIDAAG